MGWIYSGISTRTFCSRSLLIYYNTHPWHLKIWKAELSSPVRTGNIQLQKHQGHFPRTSCFRSDWATRERCTSVFLWDGYCHRWLALNFHWQNILHSRNLPTSGWIWNREGCFQTWCRSEQCGCCECGGGQTWVGWKQNGLSFHWIGLSSWSHERATHTLRSSLHSRVSSKSFHHWCDIFHPH